MGAADTIRRFADSLKLCRGDRVRFFREVLQVEPHEGQERWLTRPDSEEAALTTGNRWGKSHVAAGELIYNCAFRPTWDDDLKSKMVKSFTPYHAINISITADQAKLVWFKAHAMLQNPKASWLVKDVKMTPFPRIEFVNGAVLEARSTGGNGERLLGNVYDAVNWDEAAYEKKFYYIRDNVVRMRLLDRAGKLTFTSTGNGRNEYGRYFLAGLEGKEPGLISITGSTLENPNVNQERLRQLIARMPERMRRQNIDGQIVDAGGGFFSVDDLEASISEALTDALVVHSYDDEDQIAHAEAYVGDEDNRQPWHARYPSHRYITFWDIADKQDYMVGITLDTSEKMKLVEFERFNGKGWSYNYDRMRERHRKHQVGDVGSGSNRGHRTFFDATGVGDTVSDTLRDIRAEGLKISKPVKDEMLAETQSALSLRELEMPMIPVLYDECKFYEREDKDLVQDCVMALAGAVHFGKRKRTAIALAI